MTASLIPAADEREFLRDILAAPGDDTPRLIYADWLDDNAEAPACKACNGRGKKYDPRNGCTFGVWYKCQECRGLGGDPFDRRKRADFIRVQCELARHPLTPHADGRRCHCGGANRDCPWCLLHDREGQLWGHLCGTMAHIQGFGSVGLHPAPNAFCVYPHAQYTRGFISDVWLSPDTWIRLVERIAWRPDWEWECGNCLGSGIVGREFGYGSDGPCPDCGGVWETRDDESDRGFSPGTGLVRLPEPTPGACPIERVHLLSWPDGGLFPQLDMSRVERVFTSPRWPGIDFHLPHPDEPAA